MPLPSVENRSQPVLPDASARESRLRELMALHRQHKALPDSAQPAVPLRFVAAGQAPASAHEPDDASFMQDWDMLFDAVCLKLREAVDEELSASMEPSGADDALALSLMRARVLDGLSALDHLHRILRAQRAKAEV